jgi:hypothetical protein
MSNWKTCVLTVLLVCTVSCKSADKLNYNDMTEQQVENAMQMISLQSFATALAFDQDSAFPPSIGHIVLSDWSVIDFMFKPSRWPPDTPADFERWQTSRKIAWINANTDYAYFLSEVSFVRSEDDIVELDSDYVSFMQLPQSTADKWVILCFMDRHFEVWSYEKADRQITEQTGQTIAEWIDAKSPGSGRVALPSSQQ